MTNIVRCVITKEELVNLPCCDEYAIQRLLVQKGFISTTGIIQPKLSGIVGYTIDFETGDRNFFQDLSEITK